MNLLREFTSAGSSHTGSMMVSLTVAVPSSLMVLPVAVTAGAKLLMVNAKDVVVTASSLSVAVVVTV